MSEIDDLIKGEIPTQEELGLEDNQEQNKIINNLLKERLKEQEGKIVEVIGDCKTYRHIFILKKELIRKLEEAFPEKKNAI